MIEVLAELQGRPPSTWRGELQKRYPDDPGLVAQAMMWLHAARAQASTVPTSLGGRYELGMKIDVGATAEVWRAYDRRLDRNVAIKLFRLDRSPVLSEILAEARAASDLVSDHVVRVFDVHDNEPPYIVMELIAEHEPRTGALAPGLSAAALRPTDLREAACWLRDIARGVADAHLRNVFHRDLKPANVLIAPVSRRARIADFGLAAGAASDRIRVVGTPEYIAPEQARGLPARLSPTDADERATLVGLDVWGLGAVGYALITEHAPWQASGELEAWEVAAAATESPALGRTRLERIVGKALALRPADRYASAGALAAELDLYLAHKPTSLDRSPLTRGALFTRRNPQLVVTALLAMVLATMSVLAYRTTLDVREQRNQLSVEMARSRADNAELAEHARTTRGELDKTEKDLAIVPNAGKGASSFSRLGRILRLHGDQRQGVTQAHDVVQKDFHLIDAGFREFETGEEIDVGRVAFLVLQLELRDGLRHDGDLIGPHQPGELGEGALTGAPAGPDAELEQTHRILRRTDEVHDPDDGMATAGFNADIFTGEGGLEIGLHGVHLDWGDVGLRNLKKRRTQAYGNDAAGEAGFETEGFSGGEGGLAFRAGIEPDDFGPVGLNGFQLRGNESGWEVEADLIHNSGEVFQSGVSLQTFDLRFPGIDWINGVTALHKSANRLVSKLVAVGTGSDDGDGWHKGIVSEKSGLASGLFIYGNGGQARRAGHRPAHSAQSTSGWMHRVELWMGTIFSICGGNCCANKVSCLMI